MSYELVPFELHIPAAPTPDRQWLQETVARDGFRSQSSPRTIPTRGLTTNPTSFSAAEHYSATLFAALRRAIARGDRPAIWKILEDHPELICLCDVRASVARWIHNESLRRPRGRPKGSSILSAPVVAGLVKELTSARLARSHDHAFEMLECFGLAADTARRLYYQAYSESRFKPLLFLGESSARRATDEVSRMIEQAEVLSSGCAIDRTVDIPELGGPVTVRFNATTSDGT